MAKATQKVIKKRLRSVGNTQKIARAMEMVAAAKRRRAEDLAYLSRPFTQELNTILRTVVKELGRDLDHPLLLPVKSERVALVFITPDKGLTGNMQAEAARTLWREVNDQREKGKQVEIFTVGLKGTNLARRSGLSIRAQFQKETETYRVENVYPLAHLVIKDYLAKRYSAVRVIYTEFVSALRQTTKVYTLLPLDLSAVAPLTLRETPATPPKTDILRTFGFEPGAATLSQTLIPAYVRARLYWSLLEVNASEQAARMLAMRNAAQNAGELIQELQLEYNRIRQQSITQELAEIMGGSAAINQ